MFPHSLKKIFKLEIFRKFQNFQNFFYFSEIPATYPATCSARCPTTYLAEYLATYRWEFLAHLEFSVPQIE